LIITRNFKLGIILTSLYYGIGYFSPTLIQNYLPKYKSDACNPGLDFLIISVFLLGGILLTILSAFKFLTNRENDFYKGILISSIICILTIITFDIIN
jgi:hypothetical protein